MTNEYYPIEITNDPFGSSSPGFNWFAGAGGLIDLGLSIWDRYNAQRNADRNFAWNKEIDERNFAFTQEQYQYQKYLNELTMQREDNAVQRRMADLKASGINPVIAGGSGGASSTALRSAEAPRQDFHSKEYVNLPKINAMQMAQSFAMQNLQMRMLNEQIKGQKAQNKYIESRTNYTDSSTILNDFKQKINDLVGEDNALYGRDEHKLGIQKLERALEYMQTKEGREALGSTLDAIKTGSSVGVSLIALLRFLLAIF